MPIWTEVERLLKLQAAELQLIQRAMTRLRLTPQNRYDSRAAGNRISANETPSIAPAGIPKPWERAR